MEPVATLTHDDTATLRRDVDRLKSDLRQIRGDLAGLGEDAARVAKVGAAQVKDTVEDQLKAAAVKGRESVQAIEHQVAAHPLMALTTAFAVGLVVGVSVCRKG